MQNSAQAFISFVQKSPTAFHSAANFAARLEREGFLRLNEAEPWSVRSGGRYFVTRNQSSLVAFTVPETGLNHFQIVASHSDSPMFKLKPVFEDEACGRYLRLNVERYGGMLMAPWFDRPLSIAGRVLLRQGDRVAARLVDLDRDAVLIPNMPIHFNREVNDGYKYNPQVDLLPLYGDEKAKGGLMAEVAARLDAAPADIAGYDLFVYNRMPGTVWGAAGEYFSCPRIDDLECAWTSMEAFLAAGVGPAVNVCAVFDNEEVGSLSKQGAGSTLLEDALTRCALALGADESRVRALISGSFMVSADNAHAVHPNHPEKYDAGNRAFMNGGVVIKHNANQKYTTDAVSQAIFAAICRRAGAPLQQFANRSDVLGGSTLGNIANGHASMNTVDIGLPQLAMHSCYETAGTADLDHMIRALTEFYRSDIRVEADGSYRVTGGGEERRA